MKKIRFRPTLANIINIMDDKGYDVLPVKIKDCYISWIFFNGNFFKEGRIQYNTHLDCLEATYIKLHEIYGK